MSESNKPSPEQIRSFLEETLESRSAPSKEEISDFLDDLPDEEFEGVILHGTKEDIKKRMEKEASKAANKVRARFYPELHRRTGHKKPIELCNCPMGVLWREFH